MPCPDEVNKLDIETFPNREQKEEEKKRRRAETKHSRLTFRPLTLIPRHFLLLMFTS